MTRLSVIGFIDIDNVSYASTVFIGDNCAIVPRTQAIAVRRDFTSYYGNEGSFADYPIFRRRWPRLPVPTDVRVTKRDEGVIRVDFIQIKSISTSAVLQAGSTHTVDAEFRVKQFRQLASQTPGAPAPDEVR
ncbi:spore germination protein GerPE [Gorillibacterium sp. sgz500922]|uniref:spore germination protein GerPE n=1 Tax=Gorillibacterium sp. sgz500922 TaxID=3446694 RepID=UPI003F680FA1